MTSIRDFAHAYARLGWPILPVEVQGKKPLRGQGINHATSNIDTVDKWFRDWPDANIGIRLDAVDLAAVDIDPRNGGSLDLSLKLPRTLTATTASGGAHLVYSVQPGARLPGKLSQGVDLKHRGYIVVEPSRTGVGAYRWQAWNPLDGSAPPISPAPPFQTTEGLSNAKGGSPVPPGTRNEHLSREAYRLRMRGLSDTEILALLRETNRICCNPPLADDEVAAIVAGKRGVLPDGVSAEDFYAVMETGLYLFSPTRASWPATSINSRLPRIGGVPPAQWLARNRPVDQLTWAPGDAELIRNRVVQVAGWIEHPGATVFNLYRPPQSIDGDPSMATKWLDHLQRTFPVSAQHLVAWFAHRVQHPAVKCNHALVLGGPPGVGKDSILVPVRAGVGAWNCHDITPSQLLGRFNGFAKSVLLVISEARDLGDVDRFAFHDHAKTYIAAPPDVLRVDEKNTREHYVPNLCGVVITTNHRDALYLPADDRRHYVAWSEAEAGDFGEAYFRELYRWYDSGGIGHVVAYLRAFDLSGFDAKAPPPKTAAFWSIVQNGEAPEASELRDAVEHLGSPDALTLRDLQRAAESLHLAGITEDLNDRKNRRRVPHQLGRVGYTPLRNPSTTDGRWKVSGRNVLIYARARATEADRLTAARTLIDEGRF